MALRSEFSAAEKLAEKDSIASDFINALQSSTPSDDISIDLIQNTPENVLYHFLPLTLSVLQFIGEYTTDREVFASLLTAFRFRLLKCRVLKLRFLLHTSHPSFQAYWRVNKELIEGDMYNDNPFEHNTSASTASREFQLTEYDDDDDDAADTEDNPYARSRGFAGSSKAEKPEEDYARRKIVEQVAINIPLDKIDQESVEFWLEKAHAENVDEGEQFDVNEICNPFYYSKFSTGGLSLGSRATVIKVFSSMARPRVITLQNNLGQASRPSALVKSGDNMMYDLGVMHVFQFLNYLWSKDPFITSKFPHPPLALWYDVIPSSLNRGSMEAMDGLQSLKDFQWEEWIQSCQEDKKKIFDTIRSAAGSYIGTYILGYVRQICNYIYINMYLTIFTGFLYKNRLYFENI